MTAARASSRRERVMYKMNYDVRELSGAAGPGPAGLGPVRGVPGVRGAPGRSGRSLAPARAAHNRGTGAGGVLDEPAPRGELSSQGLPRARPAWCGAPADGVRAAAAAAARDARPGGA